jgi:hypothetical protein
MFDTVTGTLEIETTIVGKKRTSLIRVLFVSEACLSGLTPVIISRASACRDLFY